MKKVQQEREKLFARESSQQAKEECEIFLGLILILLLSMESKLNYNYFFGFSQKKSYTQEESEKIK